MPTAKKEEKKEIARTPEKVKVEDSPVKNENNVETLVKKMAEANDGEKLTEGPESISSVPAVGTLETKGGGTKKYLLIALLVVFLLGLIGGGIFVYQKAMKGKEETLFEPETPLVEEQLSEEVEEGEAEEEEEVILERADLKIKVLNGSGVAGLAGEMAEFLENLGYEDIGTGNAGSYDYETTEIAIKEDKKDYLDTLIEDLEAEYTLAEETSILDADDDFDAVIILGASSNE